MALLYIDLRCHVNTLTDWRPSRKYGECRILAELRSTVTITTTITRVCCDPTLPWCTHPAGWGLSNTGLFTGLQADRYWFSTEYDSMAARYLHFNEGIQNNLPNSSSLFAWAVRSGDISAVPVPAAAWHFGSGLLGLIGIPRRKQAA